MMSTNEGSPPTLRTCANTVPVLWLILVVLSVKRYADNDRPVRRYKTFTQLPALVTHTDISTELTARPS